MSGCTGAASGLPLPSLLNQAYFAYGLLKPGELAYGQIEPFVDGAPVPAHVEGQLYVRDGLPLLVLSDRGIVSGHLMRFRVGTSTDAYKAISIFEPKKHYRWKAATIRTKGEEETANVLVGREPKKGSIVFDEDEEWTGRRDPVLTVGLETVCELTQEWGTKEFSPAPSNDFDWPRFFRVQMTYLLLWTVTERFAALAYGPALKPMEKIKNWDPTKRSLRR